MNAYDGNGLILNLFPPWDPELAYFHIHLYELRGLVQTAGEVAAQLLEDDKCSFVISDRHGITYCRLLGNMVCILLKAHDSKLASELRASIPLPRNAVFKAWVEQGSGRLTREETVKDMTALVETLYFQRVEEGGLGH